MAPTNVPLGTLEVGEKIGEGGFGTVHEATLTGLKLRFAVKFLNPSAFNDDAEAARRRFFQEAEMLMLLRHPYIIPIYGVGEFEGKPYILMERFDGLDLNAARASATPENILPFLEYVAEGLAYAHKTKIVHRDIKPSNLMARKGTACILDFGIASWIDPDGTRLTRTDRHCVGDAFSAPELLEDPKLVDPRSDIYSLGACWFWLLTGKAPKGLNWQHALRSSVKISAQYESVLLLCVEQLDRRHQDMAALLTHLSSLRSGGPVQLDVISDEEAMVLGTIAGTDPDTGGFSLYLLEQELSPLLSKVRLQSAQRRVRRRKMVESYTVSSYDGDFTALKLTDAGSEWVEQNLDRVEALLESRRTPTVTPFPSEPGDDDIPF